MSHRLKGVFIAYGAEVETAYFGILVLAVLAVAAGAGWVLVRLVGQR